MHLTDAMRRREVSKRWRLAERWDGASPEARLARRERLPLASLPSHASQSSSKPLRRCRDRCRREERCCRRWQRGTCVPYAGTGEPQSADGETRNVPPHPSCLRPPWRTRETPRWMSRAVGKECGGNVSRKRDASGERRMGPRSRSTGKRCTPGGGLTAKAPRLRKDRNKGTKRMRTLTTVHSVELGECAGTLQGMLPWRRTAGVEPCAVKASSTVLNGRDEETYRKATRLVPTQLRRSSYRALVALKASPKNGRYLYRYRPLFAQDMRGAILLA
jgi:hypothetical protein